MNLAFSRLKDSLIRSSSVEFRSSAPKKIKNKKTFCAFWSGGSLEEFSKGRRPANKSSSS
jgi:hypothetical protein